MAGSEPDVPGRSILSLVARASLRALYVESGIDPIETRKFLQLLGDGRFCFCDCHALKLGNFRRHGASPTGDVRAKGSGYSTTLLDAASVHPTVMLLRKARVEESLS